MSLTSFRYFVFLFVTLFLYYSVQSAQKYILMVASIFFYLSISTINSTKLLLLVVFIGTITYVGAILIDRAEGRRKGIVLALCILSIMSVLFLLKYAYNVFSCLAAAFSSPVTLSWLKFGPIIGLSYYALTAIGYLIDVYWGSIHAEKNIVEVFLFIFYFPQLISGPITRFSEIKPQISVIQKWDTDRFFYGIRRMIWGYFKKLVISERFALVVTSIYGNYTNYSLIGIGCATLCYAVQLYTDFSGCMDIIMGASLLFGINLPDNFKAPFFSESIQEFWQRWHITLGSWFKDYVMYPLQKSKGIQYIGKWAKQRFGKKLGRKIPFYISMIVLWGFVGLWHGGTGYYFIASAGIPCLLLMFSDLLRPIFGKSVKILHINTECQSWKWFRRIRTLLLICICWMVVCSGSTLNFISVVNHSFTNFWNYSSFNSAVEVIGLSSLDLLLMTMGVVLLYVADYYLYCGDNIFKAVDRQNNVFKVVLINVELLIIFLYGMVGTSVFIYFQF